MRFDLRSRWLIANRCRLLAPGQGQRPAASARRASWPRDAGPAVSAPADGAAAFCARTLAGVALALLLSAAIGAGEEGLPSLPPTPLIEPLLPGGAGGAALSENERMQRGLAEQVRRRDERINGILDAHQGRRPAAALPAPATLDQPRRERDRAYEEFQRALQDFLAQGRAVRRDVLAVTESKGQEEQRRQFNASNALAVAECYRDLVSGAQVQPGDLAAGMQALDRVRPDLLAESEVPRLYYLRAWYLAERARNAQGDERARLAGEARAAARELGTRFPTSGLIPAVQAMIGELDATLTGTGTSPAPGADTSAPSSPAPAAPVTPAHPSPAAAAPGAPAHSPDPPAAHGHP